MLSDLRSATFFRRWEFSVRHNLAASAAETWPLAELLAMAGPAEREDWERLTLGYLETRGTLALRSAIAALYERASADDILLFSGGKEAIFAVFHTLMGAGDHAVVVAPAYQPLEEIPLSIGEATTVSLRAEEGWRLPLDEVAAALRPRTRLVCINFPHNPTGAILDAATFDGLVRLCEERGLFLFSDEVYRGLESEAAARRPPVADAYRRGLSLNVLSKAWGLPGLRIGWIVCRDRAALDRMEAYQHYLSDGNAGPSDILARIALSASEPILERNRAIVRDNRALLDAFFARNADRFEWRAPEAGCIAYPRYCGPGGVERFCERALQAGIALLPSSIYRSRLAATPGDRFRIGFGKRSLSAGLEAFQAFLDRDRDGDPPPNHLAGPGELRLQ